MALTLPRTGWLVFRYPNDDPPTVLSCPANYVDDDEQRIVVGDDQGMKIASFPYVEGTLLAPGVWSCVGPHDDFTVTPHAEDPNAPE